MIHTCTNGSNAAEAEGSEFSASCKYFTEFL